MVTKRVLAAGAGPWRARCYLGGPHRRAGHYLRRRGRHSAGRPHLHRERLDLWRRGRRVHHHQRRCSWS